MPMPPEMEHALSVEKTLRDKVEMLNNRLSEAVGISYCIEDRLFCSKPTAPGENIKDNNCSLNNTLEMLLDKSIHLLDLLTLINNRL